MRLSSSVIEIIACCILIFVSLLGNTILIYCTWKCITRRLPTSFALIFSLAFAHVVKNIVINAMNIIFNAGLVPNSHVCKFGLFTASLTTKLEIWFTFYLAVFYCVKLRRVVHPLRTPPNGKWRKHHLIAVFVLWVTGIAVCCPYLLFGNHMQNEARQLRLNTTYPFSHSFLYEECTLNFPNTAVELYYHQIFMVLTDLIPLALLILVSLRILILFCEQKKATYGNIWIGHDPSETEVLRASKVIVLLMFLITALWVAHFVLVLFLKYIWSWYLISTLLVVMFSGYSSINPYLLMLINYKISLQIRSLSSFCCANSKPKNLPTSSQKSIPEEPATED
ncbi:olfactory receptor class A-like protein 4 [Hyla sarda]|uniref:olfactory receptor class A-like protein 4 n=1 Tax=Hyla sarda TaxID=327740 RepID=UPI0024C46A96|nr:olfactory receptor class A-like protein 4 [Hyla sarda]